MCKEEQAGRGWPVGGGAEQRRRQEPRGQARGGWREPEGPVRAARSAWKMCRVIAVMEVLPRPA